MPNGTGRDGTGRDGLNCALIKQFLNSQKLKLDISALWELIKLRKGD